MPNGASQRSPSSIALADQAAGSAARRAACSGPAEQPDQGVGDAVRRLLEAPDDQDADAADHLVDGAGLAGRKAVVEQVRDRAVVRRLDQLGQPTLEVGDHLGLGRPPLGRNGFTAAEVDQVGAVLLEPTGEGGVVDVGEAEDVADGALADRLEDLDDASARPSVADRVDVVGGDPTQVAVPVALDRPRPERRVERVAHLPMLGTAQADHVGVAVDRVEDVLGRLEDLVVVAGLVAQRPGRHEDPPRLRHPGHRLVLPKPRVRRVGVGLEHVEADVVDDVRREWGRRRHSGRQTTREVLWPKAERGARRPGGMLMMSPDGAAAKTRPRAALTRSSSVISSETLCRNAST